MKKREYEITDDELIGKFEDKYNMLLIPHGLNNNKLSYMTKNNLYDLSFLNWGEIIDIVEKSLKEDKNFLLEKCKNKIISSKEEQIYDLDYMPIL